jgi:hypothetical protein
MSASCFEKGIFMFKALLVSGSLLLLMVQPSSAQDAAMEKSGEKWQAAKAAGSTNGATWPKFLAECRSNLRPRLQLLPRRRRSLPQSLWQIRSPGPKQQGLPSFRLAFVEIC